MNNHFKTVMTVAFFSLCANLFAATPNFKFTGKTVDELLPSGWIVQSRDTGDMNKDGVKDLLLMLQDTLSEPDPQCRTFYVAVCWGSKEGIYSLFGVYSFGSGCELALEDEAFPADGPYRKTSELYASINSTGSMRIFIRTQFWLASHQLIETTNLFRFQNGDFYLIGSEHYQYGTSGGSAGYGYGSSKNYLTGKMYEYDVEQYQKKKGKWGVMEKAPLTSLESIVKK